MNLALFDLDNTLLSGDSDFEWSQFLIEQGVLERELFEIKNLTFYEQYKAGTLDIYEFLEYQLRPLSRHSRHVLDAWLEKFIRQKVLKLIGAPAKNLVAQHRNAGDICVIITATNSFVTAPIARQFGVEHLIATEPEHKNGEFTGQLADTPCFREGKIICLESWMARRGWDWNSFNQSCFYSDSLNDLPLLGKVKTPVAVDPDITLRTHATQQGWRIISLRE